LRLLKIKNTKISLENTVKDINPMSNLTECS
jgi:hypothetical protein